MKMFVKVWMIPLIIFFVGWWADSAIAQITLNEATMESSAVAETDAGPEYNYYISRLDELDALGPYTFTEYGSAPGYNSQATVGVEHNSNLATDRIDLSGVAYAYVADDYGYAYCSADSQVAAHVTFTLSQECRIQIDGALGFAGYSATEADAYFSLRRYGQPNMITVPAAGGITFDEVLPAGTYQITVLSRVWLEINFSGGDVYEFSRGTFDLSLLATPIQHVPPQFLNVKHFTTCTSYYDDNLLFDQRLSRKFLPFSVSLDASQSAALAQSSLNSHLDKSTGVFWVYGHAASGLYVQGTASSEAQSDFRSDFQLAYSGHLELSGIIGVTDYLGGQIAYDTPGFAQVFVRLRDLDQNRNVFNKSITMNGNPPVNNEFVLESSFANVPLPAGRYRLIVQATSRDNAVNEEVAGSLAVAFLEVEGRVVEQGPQ